MGTHGWRWAAVPLSIAVLVTVGTVALLPPKAAHADPPCGGEYVLYARGSDQVIGDVEATAFKGTVFSALNAVTPNVSRNWAELGNLGGDIPQGQKVPASGHGYPAVDLSNWGIFGSMDGYYDSVDTGISELQTHLNDRVSRCPSEAIILGGYSQGADVVGRVVQSLAEPVRSHIAYVALYGDPGFSSCGNAWWALGSFAGCTVGFLGARSPYASDSLYGRLGSWCDGQDGVCTANLACGGLFPCSHNTAYRNYWILDSAPQIAAATRLKVNEFTPPGGGSKLAATRNQDGRLALFYVGGDSAIYYQFQTSRNAGWGPERRIAAYAKSVAAIMSADGRIELFYIGGDDSVIHRWQISINCDCWSPEESFGTRVKAISVTMTGIGRIEMATVDFAGQIHHRWQSMPNSWAGSSWAHIPGVASDIAMGESADGRAELFYVGGTSGVGPLMHRWRLSPVGEWSPEEGFSASIQKVAATRNHDGRLEVFAIGDNKHLFTKWQTQPNVWYSSWAGLPGLARYLTAVRNDEGRLELFYIGLNSRIYHQWQQGQGCCWSGETLMYGSVAP